MMLLTYPSMIRGICGGQQFLLTSDREKKDKFIWGDYAEKIFNMIVQQHTDAKKYHLINDRYDVESSIKDAEHQKRNLLFIGGAKNVYPSQK